MGNFARRFSFFGRLISLLLLASLLFSSSGLGTVRAETTTSERTFPETGKTVQGSFLQYWDAHGGLAQFGYPISDEMAEKSDIDGKSYTVQYFERAVFELHPENTPPNDVLLSLLGTLLYQQKYPTATGAPNQQANSSAGSVLFKETGKTLGGLFLDYWNAHGGVAQYGYPISDEFSEKSDLDGKTYTVQYFERAVFEYHPENAAPDNVLLSQLGTFRYQAKYPQAAPTPTPGSEGSISPVALAYLNEALNTMQTYSLASADADWDLIRSKTLAFAKELNPQTAVDTYPAIRFAVSLLGDDHAEFWTREQFVQDASSKQPDQQIGLSVSYTTRTVTAVSPTGFAEQVGIQVGDIVDTINDAPVADLDISTFFARLFSGREVNLGLKRVGDAQDIHATINHPYIDPLDVPHGRRLPGGIGYIDVPGVLNFSSIYSEYANMEMQILSYIDQTPTCGWVVDLQLDYGGTILPMFATIGPIVGDGKLGSIINQAGDRDDWYYRNGQVEINSSKYGLGTYQADNPYMLKNQLPPVAVLTSKETASAGEATAIGFRERPGARSFGVATFGVPNGPSFITLSDGAGLKLTTAHEADRTGHDYRYNERLQPDQYVYRAGSNTSVGTDDDPVVQAGVAWLQTQAQCAK